MISFGTSRRATTRPGVTVFSAGLRPTSDFIFDGRALPAGLTFTRASGATRINQRGYLEEVAADVLRYSYDPALTYNLAPNPWGDGAPPTEWGTLGGSSVPAPTFVLSGVRDGIAFTRWRIQGTSTGNQLIIVSPFGTGSLIPASIGQTFNGQMYVEVARVGATNTWTGMAVRTRGKTANTLTAANNEQTSTTVPDAARFADGPYRAAHLLAVGGSIFAETILGIFNVNGFVFDVDIDIGFPVVNTGASYLTDTVPLATLAARVGTTPQYGLLGALVERIPATNLFLNSAVGVTQNVTTTAVQHTLSFTGTGSITLTGTSTAGPLVGTGASNRVSLVFTPSAGSLTLTIAGDVRMVQLETGFLSSYIVTAGVATTRAADIANIDPALIDLNRSSIAMRFRIERGGVAVAAANQQTVVSVRNGSANVLAVETGSGQTFPSALSRRAASDTSLGSSAVGSGAFQSAAIAWGDNSATRSWSGGATGGGASSPIGPATDMQIGSRDPGGAQAGNNTISYLRIWKGRRLTAAQVQAQSARTS